MTIIQIEMLTKGALPEIRVFSSELRRVRLCKVKGEVKALAQGGIKSGRTVVLI